MKSSKMYPQPLALSEQMTKKAHTISSAYRPHKKYEAKSFFPYSLSSLTKSSASKHYIDSTETKSNSPSPSPSPALSDPLNDLKIKRQIEQSRKSKKRKLNQARNNNSNCLKKVTLSDGSVCYTMVAPESKASQKIQQPPKKKQRSNSFAPIKSSPVLCRPPKKKMRTNSYTPVQETKSETVPTPKFEKNQDSKNKKAENKKQKHAKKPPLLHSNTMPFPIKYDKSKEDAVNKKKRKRRHSINGDWTSRDNILASLKKQERIEDKLFPSGGVPQVNLEEIFNGQQFIRVHKKIRPINLRRETQLFKQDKKLLKY